MNANHIESKFAAMGARLKVREIASRWRQGDRSWIESQGLSPWTSSATATGEFFELRVPTHLSESLDVAVMQAEPKQRHLLLAVRKAGDKLQNSTASSAATTNANGSLLPCRVARRASVRPWTRSSRSDVRAALARNHVSSRKRYARKNRAFRRQGEWFFVPEPSFVVDEKLVLRNEPLRRGSGQAASGGRTASAAAAKRFTFAVVIRTVSRRTEYRAILRSAIRTRLVGAGG